MNSMFAKEVLFSSSTNEKQTKSRALFTIFGNQQAKSHRPKEGMRERDGEGPK